MRIPEKLPTQRYVISIAGKYYTGVLPSSFASITEIVRSDRWKKLTKNGKISFWNLPVAHRRLLWQEFREPEKVVRDVAQFETPIFGFSEDIEKSKKFNKISSLNNAIKNITDKFPIMKPTVKII